MDYTQTGPRSDVAYIESLPHGSRENVGNVQVPAALTTTSPENFNAYCVQRPHRDPISSNSPASIPSMAQLQFQEWARHCHLAGQGFEVHSTQETVREECELEGLEDMEDTLEEGEGLP
eukprot:NODE_1797_length_1404_cov_20.780812_g306_i1.p4 GENE.NODE_1797_length_1404_cov_20.780812_g306_i1~~NODE_1797_length_1404_cov_20.780812_g306_i1.p4  ORF type:complete len:119 (-),score=16.02 NODE_1797_length_1404_cov_20.780812_g306_i1:675-1031(-)